MECVIAVHSGKIKEKNYYNRKNCIYLLNN